MNIYTYVHLLDLHGADRGHEQAVCVVPGQKDGLEVLHDARLLEAEVLRAHDGRVDQVEPQRVGAVGVDHLGRR